MTYLKKTNMHIIWSYFLKYNKFFFFVQGKPISQTISLEHLSTTQTLFKHVSFVRKLKSLYQIVHVC